VSTGTEPVGATFACTSGWRALPTESAAPSPSESASALPRGDRSDGMLCCAPAAGVTAAGPDGTATGDCCAVGDDGSARVPLSPPGHLTGVAAGSNGSVGVAPPARAGYLADAVSSRFGAVAPPPKARVRIPATASTRSTGTWRILRVVIRSARRTRRRVGGHNSADRSARRPGTRRILLRRGTGHLLLGVVASGRSR
jgi:hypothetical protein